MNYTPPPRRVQILRDSVAQKIAAGEVIDRPYSVVRELIDNSIDAGASSIDLSIEKGGLKKIRVADDGCGMSGEDLELCFQPHATSKIEDSEDIYHLTTLGFRGEALASIAACTRLTVTSAAENGDGHRLEVRDGRKQRMSPAPAKRGSVVEALDIFYGMPGRRKFLKSAGAETSACKRTFVEKALPYPELDFRFVKDGAVDLHLGPAGYAQRVADAHPGLFQPEFLYEIEDEAGDFSFTAVLSSPSIVRSDRRYIHIYVNGRRIQEYSLIQAVEYAYRAVLPGGSFPAAFLFLRIEPDLVDFNIHPAKREAKIKNLPQIHHEVVERIGEFLKRYESEHDFRSDFRHQNEAGTSEPAYGFDYEAGAGRLSDRRGAGHIRPYEPGSSPHCAPSGSIDISRLRRVGEQSPHYSDEEPGRPREDEPPPASQGEPEEFVYHGQALGFFLIVERRGELLLIDQHAAHERIIYNELLESPGRSQPLLVGHRFEIEEDEERLLLERLDEYREINISVEQEREGVWYLNAVPEKCTGMEAEIIDFLLSPHDSVSSIRTALYADIACKRAVKEGERLDETSAVELIRKSLSLPEPRCPHGRPVWLRLTEAELYRLIGRT